MSYLDSEKTLKARYNLIKSRGKSIEGTGVLRKIARQIRNKSK